MRPLPAIFPLPLEKFLLHQDNSHLPLETFLLHQKSAHILVLSPRAILHEKPPTPALAVALVFTLTVGLGLTPAPGLTLAVRPTLAVAAVPTLAERVLPTAAWTAHKAMAEA